MPASKPALTGERTRCLFYHFTKRHPPNSVHQTMTQLSLFDDRGRKFLFFILGLTLPIAGVLIWSAKCRPSSSRKQQIDQAHDVTVEDSFPASDPPSAW
jgi:hypothetical protein